MSYLISREDVWVGEIDDRVGGLADRLNRISKAGVNLEFVISRRAPERPGKGVLFLVPAPGDDMNHAADQAGLSKWATAASLRVEGPDRPELLMRITRALADAGVNVRGVSGATLGQMAVFQLALDSGEDAAIAGKTLDRLLNGE